MRFPMLRTLGIASALLVGAPAAHAAVVNIAGTHSAATVNASFGNYRPFDIDTSVLFDPLAGPVSVTGSVNISSLLNNSTVYVGLISKIDYNEWLTGGVTGATDPTNSTTGFFGFIDTAYGAFNTLSGGRLQLGQQRSFGDTTQTTVGAGLGMTIGGFTLTFGDINFSGTTGGPTATQTYGNGFDYVDWFQDGFVGAANNIGHPQPTDWSQGAYAFVGTFFDKNVGGVGCASTGTCAPVIDVTFSGPSVVPEPASLALLALGLAGLGFSRRRRQV